MSTLFIFLLLYHPEGGSKTQKILNILNFLSGPVISKSTEVTIDANKEFNCMISSRPVFAIILYTYLLPSIKKEILEAILKDQDVIFLIYDLFDTEDQLFLSSLEIIFDPQNIDSTQKI
ncbi:hypothetical protein ABPG74_006802 [Tetrahymena malaccensis]